MNTINIDGRLCLRNNLFDASEENFDQLKDFSKRFKDSEFRSLFLELFLRVNGEEGSKRLSGELARALTKHGIAIVGYEGGPANMPSSCDVLVRMSAPAIVGNRAIAAANYIVRDDRHLRASQILLQRGDQGWTTLIGPITSVMVLQPH